MQRIRQAQQDRLARDLVGRHLACDLAKTFGAATFSPETGCIDYDLPPRRARMVLDEKGRIVQSYTPLGRSTRFQFQGERLRALQTSAGVVSYFGYDATGFPNISQRSDGATEQFVYSPTGDIQRYVLSDGTVMRFERDVKRRLKRFVDRNGSETRWVHDEEGRLTGIVDPRRNQTRFTYTSGTLPVRISRPDGTVEDFTYHSASIERSVDRAHHSTISYDPTGRLTRVEYADGTTLALTYGEQGKVVFGSVSEVTTQCSYDSDARLLIDRTGAHAVSCTYDNGQLSRVTLPDGQSVAYEYDADGRVNAVVDWSGRRQELSYGLSEQPVQRRLPNGLTEYYQLDPLDRLCAIDLAVVTGGEARPIWRESYGFDVMDRIAIRHDNRSGRTDFEYDAAGQLVAARGVKTEQFAYDAAGNRVFGSGQLVSYDMSNRAISDGRGQYEFDERGNRSSSNSASGRVRYEYDLRDQLIGIVHADGSRTEYAYDAFSRRIRKHRGARVTEYIWLGHQMVQEIVTEGNTRHTCEYLYEPGAHKPLAMRLRGSIYYYHCDRLGTPQLLTDARGIVVWSAHYEAFGDATVQLHEVEQPLRFLGQYFDGESGLHYNRARYYDPALGSYLSADPALPPGSANQYRYVSGNPINLSDPLGLFGESWPGWVKTAVSVAGSIAVGVAVVALAPEIATVGAAVALAVGVGALAGAAGFGLNAAMTPGACVPCAMLEGGIVGAIAAIPFAAAIIFGGPIAAMGVGTVAAIGAASGAAGYIADCALYDHPWNTGDFLKTVAISAATAGLFHYMGGKFFPSKGSSNPPPDDPATSPAEETPAQRLARRKAENLENSRQKSHQEGMDDADRKGKFAALSDDDQNFLNEDPKNKALAYDPDTKSYKPDEARTARQAESDETVKGPVRRADGALNPSEQGADYVDGDNKPWDVKDASHGADNIANNAKSGENVLVDGNDLSPADRSQLQKDINQRLANDPNAGDVRVVGPPGNPPIPQGPPTPIAPPSNDDDDDDE